MNKIKKIYLKITNKYGAYQADKLYDDIFNTEEKVKEIKDRIGDEWIIEESKFVREIKAKRKILDFVHRIESAWIREIGKVKRAYEIAEINKNRKMKKMEDVLKLSEKLKELVEGK